MTAPTRAESAARFRQRLGFVIAAVAGQHKMPSVFRFLTLTGLFAGVIAGGLYFLAIQYEPEPRQEVKAVPGIKIRK